MALHFLQQLLTRRRSTIIWNKFYWCHPNGINHCIIIKTQAWCTTLVQAGHEFAIKGHIMRIQKTEQNNEKTPKHKDTWCEGGFNKLQFLYVLLNVHIHCLCKFQISSNRLLQIPDLTALTAHPVPRGAVYSICCTLLLPLKLRMTEWKGQCSPAALCVELL